MGKEKVRSRRLQDRAFAASFALIATAAACAIVLIATPRALSPAELPALVLAPERVRDVLREDEALAQRAPSGAEVEELQRLYLEEGRAEASISSDAARSWQRRERMLSLVRTLIAERGWEPARAMRVQALSGFMRSLRDEDADAEIATGLGGRVVALLQRYGLLDEERRMRAPVLSVRATYKVRWNMVHGLAPDAALAPEERCAYEGWVALHADAAPPARRLEAAEAYARAGCRHGKQVVAQWRYLQGDVEGGFALMREVYETTSSLRARNLALFMLSGSGP